MSQGKALIAVAGPPGSTFSEKALRELADGDPRLEIRERTIKVIELWATVDVSEEELKLIQEGTNVPSIAHRPGPEGAGEEDSSPRGSPEAGDECGGSS